MRDPLADLYATKPTAVSSESLEVMDYTFEMALQSVRQGFGVIEALENSFQRHLGDGQPATQATLTSYAAECQGIFLAAGIFGVDAHAFVPSFEAVDATAQAEVRKDGILKRGYEAVVAALKKLKQIVIDFFNKWRKKTDQQDAAVDKVLTGTVISGDNAEQEVSITVPDFMVGPRGGVNLEALGSKYTAKFNAALDAVEKASNERDLRKQFGQVDAFSKKDAKSGKTTLWIKRNKLAEFLNQRGAITATKRRLVAMEGKLTSELDALVADIEKDKADLPDIKEKRTLAEMKLKLVKDLWSEYAYISDIFYQASKGFGKE